MLASNRFARNAMTLCSDRLTMLVFVSSLVLTDLVFMYLILGTLSLIQILTMRLEVDSLIGRLSRTTDFAPTTMLDIC